MGPNTTIFRLMALAAALSQATATFDLDTSGPSWAYTSEDLADTTSQACKDAYSASINCDETLLKIVASMDPDFDPQPADLEAMCTTTCSDSLSQYIKNVNAKCDKDGDLAGLNAGRKLDYEVPVATVGEVFQYKYSQACATSGSDYCFVTYPRSPDWASGEFPCDNECAVKFFQNAHNQPGSAYFFSYFSLNTQTSWWDDVFAEGWETVVKCHKDGSDVSSVSTSESATKTDTVETSSVSSSTSTEAAISTTSASTTATETASPVRSASGATSATASSGASRLRPFFFSRGFLA
ncbi:hypothetical protein N7457_004099 [Penicillium paradoxum]|uniref:uncharacterized protein n=1 Tax=Penicillium paradoxum TaxID=176176 RepID=UPI002548625D|nr:uncharacterized protein N7457_004099 [Penicillium paradoxum]KAJ5782325.1 hypothetical protein N7457_004099 [Penicillium paradoxum]